MFAALLCCLSGWVTDPAGSTDEEAPRRWLSGDWGGFRLRLEDAGISPFLELGTDPGVAWSGPVDDGASMPTLLGYGALLDLDRIVGWSRARVLLSAYTKLGDDHFEATRTIQTPSTIDGPRETRLHELYLTQCLGDHLCELRLGKLDFSASFFHMEPAQEFLNGSPTVAQTIPDAPTYPFSALGLEALVRPLPELGLRLGAYDTSGIAALVPGRDTSGLLDGDLGIDDGMLIGELDLHLPLDDAGLRLLGGAWAHTGTYEDPVAGERDGAEGWYVGATAALCGRDGPRGLDAFAAFSVGDTWVSALDRHWLCGLRLRGPLASRPADSAGLMLSVVRPNDRLFPGLSTEQAFELYYRVQLNEWLTLQPDLQVFADPAGDASRSSEWIVQVRLWVVF